MKEKMQFLEKNLDRMNYWLQFAEAKNAAAIAYITAILIIVCTTGVIPSATWLILITAVYAAGIIIALASFFPRYHVDVYNRDGEYDDKDNYLFWLHIAKYAVPDYIRAVKTKFFEENEAECYLRSETMYAEEIIANARIAKAKYEMFKWVVRCCVIGTLMIPISIIFTSC